MKISAQVKYSYNDHQTTVATNDNSRSIDIAGRSTGFGSSVNGGELLFLALATCYCNDIYREAAKRGIKVEQVEVMVDGQFGSEGEPATNVTYRAKVIAHASEAEIQELIKYTDSVAEIQNTLRTPTTVTLDQIEAIAV